MTPALPVPVPRLRHGLAVLFALLLTTALSAQISVQGWWRLGEADSYGTANNTISNNYETNDSSGNGRDLYADNEVNAVYRSNTPSSSQLPAGSSSLSMQFGGGAIPTYYQAFSTAVFSSVTDNFGLEAWVNIDGNDVSPRVIAFNGNTNVAGGYGLVMNNDLGSGTIEMRFGTSTILSTTISTNTWTHLAMVRDNGTTTLYVSGAAVAYSTSTAISSPTGYFTIGESGDNSGKNFNGYIDEVRYFTFDGGSFSTSNLNYSAVPEPSTYAALAGLVMLGFALWRRQGRV